MRLVFIAAALIALIGLVNPASAQETPAPPAWKIQTCKQGPEQFPVCQWIELPLTTPKPVVKYYAIMEDSLRQSPDLSVPLPDYINRETVLVVAHGYFLMHHVDGTIFPDMCFMCYRLKDGRFQIGRRDLSQDGIMKTFLIMYLDYPRLEAPAQ